MNRLHKYLTVVYYLVDIERREVMTKIDIISGFLGAGKTTLIKKLIKEALHDEKIILIENEFGEIGIDGGFMADAGIEIREMNSGCICCSLVGDFSLALKKVLKEYTPDRIIIEPSGVGKLSDVIKAVQGVQKEAQCTLNSLTTVVDANKCNMYMKNFGEFFNNQIAFAQTILLSRTQLMKENKLQALVHELRHHNEQAHIVTTPWDLIEGNEIVSVMEKAQQLEKELLEETVCSTCGHVHEGHHHHDGDEHDHHADEVFMSWGIETPKTYDQEELETILKALSKDDTYGFILRAKGMLEDSHHAWLYFDMVPQEYEIRCGNPTYTGRFCIIGSKLNIGALKTLFKVE